MEEGKGRGRGPSTPSPFILKTERGGMGERVRDGDGSL